MIKVALIVTIIAILIIIVAVFMSDVISSFSCQRKALTEPDRYDRCAICFFWFSHSNMYYHPKLDRLAGMGAWVCDGCRARYELYIDERRRNEGKRQGKRGTEKTAFMV